MADNGSRWTGSTDALAGRGRDHRAPGQPRPPGYDLVMAVSRLPVQGNNGGHDVVRWQEGSGRILSPLRPMVAARNGGWIGWTGHPGTGPGPGSGTGPSSCQDHRMHPVPLSKQEADDYYHGHCGTTLAPLYHGCVAPPVFHRRWREAYRVANRRFATAAARAAAPEALVWVHDFHLQLVPGFLRQLRPDLHVGWLLYGPFPPAELFLRLPSRKEIMASLLSADLLGFQHRRSVENFLDLAGRMSGLPTGDSFVNIGDRRVTVGTFPVTIDTAEVQALATDPYVLDRAAAIRAGVNNPRTVFLSVGRLDQTEGIEQRLDAFAQLLARRRLDPMQAAFINVVTSNEDTATARRVRARIDRQVAQINGLHARVGRPVVHYVHQDVERDELVALYLAADVLLATPLREDLALTAKEFAAARSDGTGWLVLSELAAAADLPAALVVNPNDIDAVQDAMITAAARADGGLDVAVPRSRPPGGAGANGWAARFLATLSDCAASGPVPVGATGGRAGTVPPKAGLAAHLIRRTAGRPANVVGPPAKQVTGVRRPRT